MNQPVIRALDTPDVSTARALRLCHALQRLCAEVVDSGAAAGPVGIATLPVVVWIHIYLHLEQLQAWTVGRDPEAPATPASVRELEAVEAFLTEHGEWGMSPTAAREPAAALADLQDMIGAMSRCCARALRDAEAESYCGPDYDQIGADGHAWSLADFNFLPMRDLHHPVKARRELGLTFEPNGFAVTHNGMGYMTSCLDPWSNAFIRHGKEFPELKKPALEVGAAFGVATLAALRAGARVVANDLGRQHLETLERLTPDALRPRLSTTAAHFPDALHFEPESFSAILVSRMLHFLTIPQLCRAAELLASWLEPGGHVFVVEDSPYLGNVKAFTSVYEQRRAAGEAYPGMRENVSQIFASRADTMPDLFHFFDPEVLARTFTRVGLEIVNCRFFPRLDYPADVRLDGREGVGLIARKTSA